MGRIGRTPEALWQDNLQRGDHVPEVIPRPLWVREWGISDAELLGLTSPAAHMYSDDEGMDSDPSLDDDASETRQCNGTTVAVDVEHRSATDWRGVERPSVPARCGAQRALVTSLGGHVKRVSVPYQLRRLNLEGCTRLTTVMLDECKALATLNVRGTPLFVAWQHQLDPAIVPPFVWRPENHTAEVDSASQRWLCLAEEVIGRPRVVELVDHDASPVERIRSRLAGINMYDAQTHYHSAAVNVHAAAAQPAPSRPMHPRVGNFGADSSDSDDPWATDSSSSSSRIDSTSEGESEDESSDSNGTTTTPARQSGSSQHSSTAPVANGGGLEPSGPPGGPGGGAVDRQYELPELADVSPELDTNHITLSPWRSQRFTGLGGDTSSDTAAVVQEVRRHAVCIVQAEDVVVCCALPESCVVVL